MSVLIKGIDMPDICNLCPCTQRPEGCTRYLGAYCGVDGEPITDLGGRRDDCPLIPVPPHGRLIDADAFTKDECNYCDGACEALPCDCLNCKSDCRCDFMKDIANAPTIIPADYPPSTPLEQVWTELFEEDGEA